MRSAQSVSSERAFETAAEAFAVVADVLWVASVVFVAAAEASSAQPEPQVATVAGSDGSWCASDSSGSSDAFGSCG